MDCLGEPKGRSSIGNYLSNILLEVVTTLHIIEAHKFQHLVPNGSATHTCINLNGRSFHPSGDLCSRERCIFLDDYLTEKLLAENAGGLTSVVVNCRAV